MLHVSIFDVLYVSGASVGTFAGSEGHHGRLAQASTVPGSHLHLIQAVWLQLGQGQLVERA